MARLKVFSWSDGFHRFTVAASSRPKALAAWGISADIFKSGLAEEIHDGPDYEAALKAPEVVIERGLSVDIGKSAPSKAGGRAATARKAQAAARRKVEGLEAELAELDQAHHEQVAELERRRSALEAEAEALAARHKRARSALAARLKAARARI